MGRSSSAEEIAMAVKAYGRERRKQPRLECGGAADVLLDSGSLYHGEIKDVSLAGCYITTQEHLDLSRHAHVELSLRVNGASFSTPALVVLVRSDAGAAFEFVPVDPEMRMAHLALIRELTGQLSLPTISKAS